MPLCMKHSETAQFNQLEHLSALNALQFNRGFNCAGPLLGMFSVE